MTDLIEAFLSHLAQEANVSASTQNQALNELLYIKVTDQRTRKDWAEAMRELADVIYPMRRKSWLYFCLEQSTEKEQAIQSRFGYNN